MRDTTNGTGAAGRSTTASTATSTTAPLRTARGSSIGSPLDRVDGRLKVTGGARYAAEMPADGATYGVIVQSTIARGRIIAMDTRAAEQAPGVITVLTHRNAPTLPGGGRGTDSHQSGHVLALLQDDLVHYNGQPIALVVADTFEHATHAASLVHARYREEHPVIELSAALGSAYAPDRGGRSPDSAIGDFDAGLAKADARIDATYTTPMETHNPMEPHATIATWSGDTLTLYDSTQGIFGVRSVAAKTFGIPVEHVRVVSYFVGGGFGCKGSAWSHVMLAALAAKQVRRPVKVVLSRRQMFGPVGGRPQTLQHVTLGAAHDGTLTAIRHEGISHTSRIEDFTEPTTSATRMLYACPNRRTTQRLVQLDVGTPTYMRAPGEAPGTFALESAMDELSYALHMDPIALRLANYADRDPESDHPWSSKSLRECYTLGAARFGWARRTPEPRSMRDGDMLVGWGMATATRGTRQAPASAMARILPDGRALVQAGSQEIGTGTYTVMTQVAADALGLAPDQVRFELGDTNLPPTPPSVGSLTAPSTGSAVHLAAAAARNKAIQLAVADPASPMHGAAPESVRVENGRLVAGGDAARSDSYAAIVARRGQPIEARVDATPDDEHEQYAMHAFGATFAEVRVDPDLGRFHVSRFTGVYGVGRVLNAKTAYSQIMGGIVWGIGMALMEETLPDLRTGRIANADLAEYHVPVNADVGRIDVAFVDEHDPHVNPIGVKGIGEVGITGVAGAIANAVYHATGTRVRDLPITLDKLL